MYALLVEARSGTNFEKKKGIQSRYAISPAVDLDPATSSRESVSRGIGKDLVTIGIFRLSSLRLARRLSGYESRELAAS